MKKLLLVALPFLSSPALAGSELVFQCKSLRFSDQLSAVLRLSESGLEGEVDVQYWNGYPPITLADVKLKSPAAADGWLVFGSTVDSRTNKKAEVTIPMDFAKLESFKAQIALLEKSTREKTEYSCDRFR